MFNIFSRHLSNHRKERTEEYIEEPNTGEEVKRTYTDEELDQTFDRPATGRSPEEKTIVKKFIEKPKLNPKEMIAQRREHRIIKIPVWESL